MRLAILADTHWGVRSDHIAFLNNTKKFLDEVFFPTLEKENIKTVIHLGDLVDHRKFINMNTAYRLRQDFIDPMMEKNIEFHLILGNHDIFWRNSCEVSVASELYGYLSREKNKFYYYTEPADMVFEGKKILFLPWICDSNREKTAQFINTTSAKVIFGHLEVAGFEMYKGIVNNEGERPDVYSKFDLVCSGHFHHKSSHGNIHYLGSHGEFIWSDCHGDRGFHIFDTKDDSLRFIQNPFNMFAKVYYDDAIQKVAPIGDYETLKGKIVKVIVKSRTNSDQYNNFMVECEKAQPLELIVVEDHLNLDMVDDKNLVSETKTTLEIIREYVDASNNIVDTAALNKLIVSLYNEASSLE